MSKEEKILVTGGGGFLGYHICQLLKKKNYSVISFSRNKYEKLEELGVKQVQGDITHLPDLLDAVKGTSAVIHTASKAGFWGPMASFYKTNVIGTDNVLKAMQESRVQTLIYTSTPSVVMESQDFRGADESLPQASSFLCPYPFTKAKAEALVLKTHSPDLRTLALRPHLIWGPEDPHFIPRINDRAKKNKLFQIGSGLNKVDVIHVENAALAHVQALEVLQKNIDIGGEAYFLGQESPVNLWWFIDQLLSSSGQKKLSSKKIPYKLAYFFASLCEFVSKTVFRYKKEPYLTRFLVMQLAKSHYFSHRKAARAFGYYPKISINEGLLKLRDFYRNLRDKGNS